MRWITSLILLFSLCTYAGLPPTTSKGVADSTNVTTFNYDFPSFSVTHSGNTAFTDLATSGVVSGTYTNATVTVNAKGIVTGASSGSSGSSTSPTQQIFTSGSGTYTTPANVKWLRVRAQAGGGSAGGNGTGANDGAPGGNTTFGASITATGGGAGSANGGGTYGSSGGATGGDINIAGQYGGKSPSGTTGGINSGKGGDSFMGHGGPPGIDSTYQEFNGTGYGGGGGGAANNVATTGSSGGGGGGYVEKIITSPSATYSYSVGAGSTGGSAGTSGYKGGDGTAGILIIEEHY